MEKCDSDIITISFVTHQGKRNTLSYIKCKNRLIKLTDCGWLIHGITLLDTTGLGFTWSPVRNSRIQANTHNR